MKIVESKPERIFILERGAPGEIYLEFLPKRHPGYAPKLLYLKDLSSVARVSVASGQI